MWRRLEAARVVLDASGAPFSERYRDVYASRDGALAQARHVFIAGNALPERWRGRAQFVVVETGFGLGVNFLATWQAWRDDRARPRRLHFVSLEKHPVDAATLLRHAPAEVAAVARLLAAAWPAPLPGLHRRVFEEGGVTLTLAFGAGEDLLPQVVAGADAFFLDGFAPDRNPELWTPALMKALARVARHEATAATWCTARPVRDGLAAAGFEVELSEGFGHKRRMLRARFAPRWRVRRHDPPAAFAGARSALVVGAGLAGAHVADALAARGWQVQVIERAARPAAGASALPWGLLHPQITADDNDAARLARAGFALAHARLASLAPAGDRQGTPVWRSRGTFVQARDAEEATRWQAVARSLDPPREFARFCAADEAATLLGVAPRRPGWWFPGGTSVAAPALCGALVDNERVTWRPACAIARIRRDGQGWVAEDDRGTTVAAAPVCVVANALDAARLLGLAHAPVRAVRGQLSLLAAPALARLRAAMSGGGTLVPAGNGTVVAGATYEFATSAAPLDGERAHRSNVERLARLLAAPVDATPCGLFDAVRCVARDRLPLAGAVGDEDAALRGGRALQGAHLADLPRVPGLYASFAFGSRGLALAPLAAEWIAAQLEGEPWPVERDLAARIDGARFLLRVVRRG